MNGKIFFDIDLKVYPMEAVFGACYVFIDRVYIFLEKRSKDKIRVVFSPKPGVSVQKLKELSGEFGNELLNYAFRLNLAKENKKIRQQVVEQALFSAVSYQGTQPVSESAKVEFGFDGDPLGIAVPWEDKYGPTDAGK